jgi:hypothetical protein
MPKAKINGKTVNLPYAKGGKVKGYSGGGKIKLNRTMKGGRKK